VLRYSDLDEAIAQGQRLRFYGLSACTCGSTDYERAIEGWATVYASGTVWINMLACASIPRSHLAGYKQSGVGR